ncbi:MAG TPA: ice-binding family protein [Myxococcales bacterium]|jgi:hypothetical protein
MAALRNTLASVASFALVFVLACGGNSTATAPAGNDPNVSSTNPADAAVGVATNTKIFASFSEAMNEGSLSGVTVLVRQGTIAVPGSVAAVPGGMSVTFTPASPLAANAVYTATITSGAASTTGRALAANHVWSFTTGAAADTTAPAVSNTSPAQSATAVPINATASATFSEAMDPASLTSATFSLTQAGAPVAGSVAYGSFGTTAVFTPAASLAANGAYTATISAGALDLAGNALAAPFSWTFTTGTAVAHGPAAVGLGTAGRYAVLAKTAISTVPASAVTGDIGISPAAATFITGFSLVADSTNVFSSSPQVSGKVFAADYAVPTPSNLTTAVSNMEAAYNDAAGRPTPDHLELGTGNIGGLTLAPGLYKWTSAVTIPNDVVISGGANDVWIFQTTGDLTMSAAKHVTLAGGALAKNVFWQVAGKATFGANSHFEGIVLSKTDIVLQTGATMNGRALSQTQVVLQQATLTQPAP